MSFEATPKIRLLADQRTKISKHTKENMWPIWRAVRNPKVGEEQEEAAEAFPKRQNHSQGDKEEKGLGGNLCCSQCHSYLKYHLARGWTFPSVETPRLGSVHPLRGSVHTFRLCAHTARLCAHTVRYQLAQSTAALWYTCTSYLMWLGLLMIRNKPDRRAKLSFLHNPSPQFWTCRGDFC